jgi:hypothetical protein
MSEYNVCWKCGASLPDVLQPLPRHAECPRCHAQLHVCRLCAYYDTKVANQCREPVAEAVRDKERANFCGYFKLKPNVFTASSDQTAASRRELEALFGSDKDAKAQDQGGAADTARRQLEDLFKKP